MAVENSLNNGSFVVRYDECICLIGITRMCICIRCKSDIDDESMCIVCTRQLGLHFHWEVCESMSYCDGAQCFEYGLRAGQEYCLEVRVFHVQPDSSMCEPNVLRKRSPASLHIKVSEYIFHQVPLG